MKKIAIIGCGASGTMVLANLVRMADNNDYDITVYHHGTPLARGIAYSTTVDGHLLNVVANEMGAYSENKNDFYEWLQKHHPNKYDEKSFVSRKIYGEYLEYVLDTAKQTAANKNLTLTFVNRELSKLPDGFDHICLSLGNKLKEFALPKKELDLTKVKHIAIVGTGLSMVDFVVWLDEQNYNGKLSLISRSGNLPYAYSFATEVNVINTVVPGDDLNTALNKYSQMVTNSGDWRSVINSFRPHCNQIWQAWSLNDQQTFLSKYNSDWGVKRHKIAPEIDEQLQKYFAKIELNPIKSGVTDVKITNNSYTIMLNNGGSITCDAAINCMGLNLDAKAHPIYADMLKNETIHTSNVKTGVIPPTSPNIHVIGSALVGYLFESIAIPELRHQAYDIAQKISLA